MSTLILGFSIDDLCLLAVLAPLLAALINGALSLASNHGQKQPGLPLIKTTALLAPAVSLSVIGLLAFMLGGAPEGSVVGPYWEWLQLEGVRYDIAFWLDPLAFFMAALLALVCLQVLASLVADESDCAVLTALYNAGLFFGLLTVWAENLTVFLFGVIGLLSCVLALVAGKSRVAMAWSFLCAATLMVGLFFWLPIATTDSSTETELFFNFAWLHDQAGSLGRLGLGFTIVAALLLLGQVGAHFIYRTLARLSVGALSFCMGPALLTAGIYWMVRMQVVHMAHPQLLLGLEVVGAASAVLAIVCACFYRRQEEIVLVTLLAQLGLSVSAFSVGSLSAGALYWCLLLCAQPALWLMVTDSAQGLESQSRRVFMLLIVALLSGAIPSGIYWARHEILWQLFTQERYVTWGAFLVVALLSAFVLGRVWAIFYRSTSRKVESSQQWVFPLHWLMAAGGLLLVLMSAWFTLPVAWKGPDLFRRMITSSFEDLLPIRTEVYGAKLALIHGVSLWLCGVVSFMGGATRKVSLKDSSAIACWVEHDFYWRCVVEQLLWPVRWCCDRVIRDFSIRQIQAGIGITGVASGLKIVGRTLMLLQTGFVQHYLLWCLLTVTLLLMWVLL